MFVNFDIAENQRGPGYWKLNVSVLKDEAYIYGINELIDKTVNDYEDVGEKKQLDAIGTRAVTSPDFTNWSQRFKIQSFLNLVIFVVFSKILPVLLIRTDPYICMDVRSCDQQYGVLVMWLSVQTYIYRYAKNTPYQIEMF